MFDTFDEEIMKFDFSIVNGLFDNLELPKRFVTLYGKPFKRTETTNLFVGMKMRSHLVNL